MVAFEKLTIHTKNLTFSFYKECFISGLKEEIREQVRMYHPTTWLEATQRALEAEIIINAQTKKPTFIPRTRSPQGNSQAELLLIP
jgi:hypothetical protein